jgi:hypothetical protein
VKDMRGEERGGERKCGEGERELSYVAAASACMMVRNADKLLH